MLGGVTMAGGGSLPAARALRRRLTWLTTVRVGPSRSICGVRLWSEASCPAMSLVDELSKVRVRRVVRRSQRASSALKVSVLTAEPGTATVVPMTDAVGYAWRCGCDARGNGNGEHPRPHNPRGHTPSYGGKTLRRAHTDNSAGDGVSRADRNPKIGSNNHCYTASRFGAESADRF